jgi:hypothetical protein
MQNRIALLAVSVTAFASSVILAQTPAPAVPNSAPVDQLIPWLLKEDAELRGILFSEVIHDTTGKKVLAFNGSDATDTRVVKMVGSVLDQILEQMNAKESPIQKIERINEVSSHFEDAIRERLNSAPGLHCEVPPTVDGRLQRSGYPDLRLLEKQSGRVYYLDPKLYVAGSRQSSFRTFYFEPKIATNKVRDDAVHFILGFEHEPREKVGGWKFTRWDIVDLSQFRVKLKAEFQGSNRDMYRPEAIVATIALRVPACLDNQRRSWRVWY